MTENYEYKIIDISKKNKEFDGFWPFFIITRRAAMVMEKMTKDGWEPINTTHDFMGNPHIFTFRKKKD